MQEAPSSVFGAWSNFYVITGSSAAALTGLMFVVVTLIAGDRSRAKDDTHEGIATFSTPTVVHFCAALFISGVLSAPWRSLVLAAAALGLTGLWGIAYELRVTLRTRRQQAYDPDLEDWIWFVILPLFTYVIIALAAALLRTAPVGAPFALAGATLLLIFIGIHNAWDVVTYLATGQDRDAGGS